MASKYNAGLRHLCFIFIPGVFADPVDYLYTVLISLSFCNSRSGTSGLSACLRNGSVVQLIIFVFVVNGSDETLSQS